MKEESKVSVNDLCGLFGKTRQAFYKQKKHIEREALDEQLVLSAVHQIRKKSKTTRWGVRKLKPLVNQELNCAGIKVGRDYLFDLLRSRGMLVRKRKRKFFTTDSHHWLRKYDNLIANKTLTDSNQLWVSDITYVKINNEKAGYLYLTTDAYSQKIVGWNLSEDLKADSALVALKMAIKANKDKLSNLIHHSDRGVQYCSSLYVQTLKNSNVKISMTNPGSPQENAIAERVNGILKEEWLYDIELKSIKHGNTKVKEIIDIYNNYRPHTSLNNKTPEQIHCKRFLRHESERVIGQMYKYNKKAPVEDA
ncbi:MAG: IS3 family transposase [Psychroflexus maritimus]